jgi:cytosine/creatinine deaminase
MTYPDEVTAIFDFVTYNAAKALRLSHYGLLPGCFADINILAASTWQHVLRLQQPPKTVICRGKVIARNDIVRHRLWR